MATFNWFKIDQNMAFVQLVRAGCEDHLRKTSKGENWVETLREWWENLVQWLIENWDVVMKIVLSLLVLVDKPEEL